MKIWVLGTYGNKDYGTNCLLKQIMISLNGINGHGWLLNILDNYIIRKELKCAKMQVIVRCGKQSKGIDLIM